MFDPQLERLPRDELRALQDRRVARLARYVYERVPHYRRVMEETGVRPADVRSVEDLPKLPLTRKDDLRDHYPFGMLAVPRDQITRVHASSGTTGKPTVVAYTHKDVETFAEVNARSMAAGGARPGMLFHNAYGYGLFTGGLGLHYGGERLGLGVVPVSGGMTERQLTLILDLKPEVIACTPSYAQTLAEAFRERGVPPEDVSLRYGILGAEPWTETIRADVEAGLGIEATNIYGLSEIIGPGVANEAVEEKDGSYIWEDHFYPEIVDPATGQPLPEGHDGVLVITTLTKEALPLVRYFTGDITSLTREPGSTGRTHARIGMIRGRADDMLVVRGVNVYPTQIEAAIKDVAEASPHYQLVVRRVKKLDELELRLELTDAAFQRVGQAVLDDGTIEVDREVHTLREKIQHRIRETVGINVKLSLLAPGAAPRSEGGKLRRTVDERAL